MMQKLSAHIADRRCAPAAQRGDRSRQTAPGRHVCRDDFGIAAAARTKSDRICKNAGRQARRRHHRHAHGHDAAKCRARQRHVRPCRRNGRHPSAFAHRIPARASYLRRWRSASRTGLPGKALLRAIVLGYDICSRMLLTFKPMPYLRSGHHAAATGQVFGAAATAGALLKLKRAADPLHAVLCGPADGGTVYDVPRSGAHRESLCDGRHARAQRHAGSADGRSTAGRASKTFFPASAISFSRSRPEEVDRNEMVRGLGTEYEIMRAGIKRWPVGGPIQGPMHVLRDFILEHGIKAATSRKSSRACPTRSSKSSTTARRPTFQCSTCSRSCS